MNSTTLMATATTMAPARTPAPKTPPDAVTADSSVVARTTPPPTASNTRLRTLAAIGFGRELRGTPQILFKAFWNPRSPEAE
ncbi:hypothetical protein [Actinomadura geliboluensis]|uniref:hypothetical protein n=1 Tax=Actinomadura geliboluensis TaxID=882440 RepID=UPI0037223215